MKYAIIGICILGGLCGYFIGQVYYARGKMDCERLQVVATQQLATTVRQVQATVARDAAVTSTADIRRVLREKYTIAD